MANTTNSAARWIHNPALDLIVGCGAWSAPLLVLSSLPLANSQTWAITFYGLALFLNYPHYMSTLYRAYHNEADFQKYRIFTVHITGLILLTGILSHFQFAFLPWIFTLYLTISPWHYTGQNYGLFMMFVRRLGAQVEENTRQAIYSAFVLSYAILFLNLHTGPSDRLFLSLNLPEKATIIVRIVLAVAFVAFSAFGIRGLARQIGWKAMAPPLVLFSSQMLWFLIPGLLVSFKGMSLPQSRYTAGVLAVMHSAQYLWITSYYARRESLAEGKSWRPWAYFGTLIIGGVALFIPGPWIASYVFHYDFTSSFFIFTALVNLHHFILDGAIWKLRDGRIAALLLNTKEQVANAAGAAAGNAGRAWQWMRSQSPVPPAFRIATAIFLLALAVVDQVRYALVVDSSNLKSMQKAASLNPFDAALEQHMAQQQAATGNLDAATASYQRAIAMNMGDPIPQRAFLEYLVANQRYQEADNLAQAALKRWPRDSEFLVNEGVLAANLGRPSDAVSHWEKAITADPSLALPHLYLADEFEREQKFDQAIPHYTIYLEHAAKQGIADPGLVLPVFLKLAQCNLRLNRTDQALKIYDAGRKLAAQTHQANIESVASLNQAILESKAGRTGDALHLYQNALRIDRAAGDLRGEAADWQAYGVFLRKNNFPDNLAYASLLRAASLLRDSNMSMLPEPQKIREELEASLGKSAPAIRQNPVPFLDQALILQAK